MGLGLARYLSGQLRAARHQLRNSYWSLATVIQRLHRKRWWAGAWKHGARYYRAAYHDCLADRAVRIAQIADLETANRHFIDLLIAERMASNLLRAELAQRAEHECQCAAACERGAA